MYIVWIFWWWKVPHYTMQKSLGMIVVKYINPCKIIYRFIKIPVWLKHVFCLVYFKFTLWLFHIHSIHRFHGRQPSLFLGPHMRIQLSLVGKMHFQVVHSSAFCPPGTAECARAPLRNKDGGLPWKRWIVVNKASLIIFFGLRIRRPSISEIKNNFFSNLFSAVVV
jgi:hypothetical protein